jgi:capsular exopolysaccharide synthesis family protein
VNDQSDKLQPAATLSRDPATQNEHRGKRRKRRRPHPERRTPRFFTGVDPHVVSLVDVTSPEAEQYRTICSRLEQMHKENGLTVIAVSSPLAGDGKTVTAINLAGTLIQFPDTRVLLVDLDLRRPAVARYLGITETQMPGVVGFVDDRDVGFTDTVHEYGPFKLAVLPTGRSSTTPHEVLKSRRLATLLQEARNRYDYVVVDLPPMLFPDCRLVEHLIDGVVLVISAHKTPRKLVEESLNILHPNKISGLILNNDDRPLFGYYSYYSYYYYSRPFADEQARTAQYSAGHVKRLLSAWWARSLSFLSRVRMRFAGND